MRPRAPLAALALVAGTVACAGRPAVGVSRVRFANQTPVWVVNDRVDVPTPPAERPHDQLRTFDISIAKRIDRGLAVTIDQGALGTNSLDAVPDSTWFENRIGVRAVSLDEVARGPSDGRGPDLGQPLRVVYAKQAGQIPGFLAEDASGVRWMIKFETTGVRAESASDVASQRLLWLAGYHVPENHVGTLRRDQVALGEGASRKDERGRKKTMTEADLDAVFAAARPGPDGAYMILASRILPGTPLGGAPSLGRRADDPNDTIPHERRRELRGLYVFAAWLQHTDFKEPGTLDMWTEDPVIPGRHVVLHYLVDFGNTLGLYARNARPDDGHVEKVLDRDHLLSFAAFGLWKRPWEGTFDPEIPGVGKFDVEHFDPGGFSAFAPYQPFLAIDTRDAFWAVDILLRMTPDHIRTALEAARYTDPRAIPYLTRVLVGRQRKTARYWFDRMSPLTDLTVEDSTGHDRLCFVDLDLAHRLGAQSTSTRYLVATTDWDARTLAARPTAPAAPSGRSCIDGIVRGQTRDGYTIIRVAAQRGDRTLPAVEVHVATGPDGRRRIIGIERR